MSTIQAKGHTGIVGFDGTFVTISRTGLLARAAVGQGEKRIPIRQVTAVQWKPASRLYHGFIQFTLPGGNEIRSRSGKQTFDATHDENSVVFTRKQQESFQAVRDAIELAIADQYTSTN